MSTRRRGLTESTRSTTAIAEQQQREENQEEQVRDEEEEEEEEGDEEKLEEEVAEMAKKVKEYRSTLPNQLKSKLSFLLASQRPQFSLSSHVSPSRAASHEPHLLQGAESCSENPNRELAAGDDDRTADDIKLLTDKISNNISAMPKVLKRMNECISRLDKLISSNETIHPAFKRKKS
ncbi:hypothetical protein KSS87_010449 [Heliosperma pusillum]|nr:hypothetical protein KSS87_010449 [Heliosperma pusillum]